MRINKIVFALIGCLSILGGALSLDAAELKRYVYMIQPDGSTHGGPGSRNGILVLDIDRKFSFVTRLTTPAILKVKQGVSSGNGMRGIAVCRRTARLYYDWHQGRNPGDDGAGCIDLKTGQVVWERGYDFSCERPQVSVDGKTVFIPRHWTDTKTRKIYTLDAATGEPGRVYDTGSAWPQHPFILHPDGKRLFFPGACLDLEGGKLLWTVEKGSPVVGNCHVVLDHTGTRLYTGRHAEGNTVATWILDAGTGKVAAKVPIDKQKHPDLKGISEVVAFEPGGKHFWGEADKYMVRYDNTKDPPELVALVDRDALNAAHGIQLTQPKGHAMVTGAGDYVWFSNGAVLEAQTGKYHCVMTAEDGVFTRGAKYVEVDWLDGEIVWAGQDESHGFLHNEYPIERVRPLLPGASRAAKGPTDK